jgi:hypothetical protein
MVWYMESVGDILAKSPKLKRTLKKARPLTASQEKFIEAAAIIRMNPGDTEAAFMARELVQCTLGLYQRRHWWRIESRYLRLRHRFECSES